MGDLGVGEFFGGAVGQEKFGVFGWEIVLGCAGRVAEFVYFGAGGAEQEVLGSGGGGDVIFVID